MIFRIILMILRLPVNTASGCKLTDSMGRGRFKFRAAGPGPKFLAYHRRSLFYPAAQPPALPDSDTQAAPLLPSGIMPGPCLAWVTTDSPASLPACEQ